MNFIQNINISEGYNLVSLDSISLLTNIPKTLILSILKICSLKLLNTFLIPVISPSIISFIHSQVDGSAMENKARPVLANPVTNELATSRLKQLSFTIKFLKIYIDYTILVIPAGNSNK